MASIPMISSACFTVKQSSASDTGWKPPGSWAPDKLAYSLGRTVLLIVTRGPERACPCSWLVFTLMWPLFKLSPRSTPPFFSCFLWRGPRRCPRRKTEMLSFCQILPWRAQGSQAGLVQSCNWGEGFYTGVSHSLSWPVSGILCLVKGFPQRRLHLHPKYGVLSLWNRVCTGGVMSVTPDR